MDLQFLNLAGSDDETFDIYTSDMLLFTTGEFCYLPINQHLFTNLLAVNGLLFFSVV